MNDTPRTPLITALIVLILVPLLFVVGTMEAMADGMGGMMGGGGFWILGGIILLVVVVGIVLIVTGVGCGRRGRR